MTSTLTGSSAPSNVSLYAQLANLSQERATLTTKLDQSNPQNKKATMHAQNCANQAQKMLQSEQRIQQRDQRIQQYDQRINSLKQLQAEKIAQLEEHQRRKALGALSGNSAAPKVAPQQ